MLLHYCYIAAHKTCVRYVTRLFKTCKYGVRIFALRAKWVCSIRPRRYQYCTRSRTPPLPLLLLHNAARKKLQRPEDTCEPAQMRCSARALLLMNMSDIIYKTDTLCDVCTVHVADPLLHARGLVYPPRNSAYIMWALLTFTVVHAPASHRRTRARFRCHDFDVQAMEKIGTSIRRCFSKQLVRVPNTHWSSIN